MQEALYHGTPILSMPIFGDQPRNAHTVEMNGERCTTHLEHFSRIGVLFCIESPISFYIVEQDMDFNSTGKI